KPDWTPWPYTARANGCATDTSYLGNPGVPSFGPEVESVTPTLNVGQLSRKNVLRWSESKTTSTSGSTPSRWDRTVANNCAVSELGPSWVTWSGNRGVCDSTSPSLTC